jgi:hypothetical protein
MTWRRARATAGVALGTVLVLGVFSACNSPTLPTPPPEPTQLDIPDAELLADGEHVAITGYALPGATVVFINRTLLVTNVAEASGVAVAAIDTGKYEGILKVDLRCAATNVIDITQRDTYGRDSEVRRFDAPNGFGSDAAPAPEGGTGCQDAGAPDAAPDAGDASEGAAD